MNAEMEHYTKYEALAQKIGVDKLVSLVTARWSAEHIRQWLEQGDEHLNKAMPLALIDRITGYGRVGQFGHWVPGDYGNLAPALNSPFRVPGVSMSHSMACSALKHVAKYVVAGWPRPTA